MEGIQWHLMCCLGAQGTPGIGRPAYPIYLSIIYIHKYLFEGFSNILRSKIT